MYIKSIQVTNIQAIKEYTFEFPESGLVVFTGPNSNGKSIVVKTSRWLIDGSISKPEIRRSIINREASYGEIKFTRSDGAVLFAHIAKEASLTYCSLTEPGQETVMRYIADKTYREFPVRFGLHYNKDCGISLNIAEEEEALLFYKTRHRVNAMLVEEARTDSATQNALDSITAVYSETQRKRSLYMEKRNANLIALKNLEFEDVIPLIDKMQKLQKYLEQLQYLYIPTIPEIQPVPKVTYFDLYEPKLPKVRPVPKVKYVRIYSPRLPVIKYPFILDIQCNMPDILDVWHELNDLQNNVCPTCGRRFNSCDC